MQKGSVLKKVLLWIMAVVIVLVVGTGIVFHNEIKTISSVEKIDNYGFYSMEYDSDYGLNDLLKVGASSNEDLIQFIVDRMAKGIPVKIDIGDTDLSCTTFNAVTPKGDYIFGRNFDMGYAPGIIVHTKPTDGYESISMVNLGFLGYKEGYMPDSFINGFASLGVPYAPLDGINEKGLSIGILLLPDKPTEQETDKIDITCTAAIRLLLDKAATVDEAVALLKKYDMHDAAGTCYHYQITDAAGKSVIVEYVNNEMHVLKPEASYQACTNFYQTPGEKYNMGDGQNRYNIAMTGLKAKNGIVTEKEGMKLLKAARIVDSYDKKADIMYNTQWSAIYNDSRKSLDICVGQKYNKTYHFTLE
ncbi:MAG: carcinine hydrolase/isopenicillin-N N-acyltransferase family protein [Ignavibacteriales bacterium]